MIVGGDFKFSMNNYPGYFLLPSSSIVLFCWPVLNSIYWRETQFMSDLPQWQSERIFASLPGVAAELRRRVLEGNNNYHPWFRVFLSP